jgi:hypothetical protein
MCTTFTPALRVHCQYYLKYKVSITISPRHQVEVVEQILSEKNKQVLHEFNSNKKNKISFTGIRTHSPSGFDNLRLPTTLYVRTVICPSYIGLIMFGHSIWPEPEFWPIMFGLETAEGHFFFKICSDQDMGSTLIIGGPHTTRQNQQKWTTSWHIHDYEIWCGFWTQALSFQNGFNWISELHIGQILASKCKQYKISPTWTASPFHEQTNWKSQSWTKKRVFLFYFKLNIIFVVIF